MKIKLILLSLLIVFVNLNSCSYKERNDKKTISKSTKTKTIDRYNYRKNIYNRRNGFVPDKVTAAKIAEIILVNIYGESIKNQKPFIVTLKDNNIWVIQGRWNSKDPNLKGGVAYMEIQKSDCKILKVIHGK